jgi:hypothetical protein
MLAIVQRGGAEACGHIGHPFTNFVAVHNHFPFVRFATTFTRTSSTENQHY